MGERKILYKGCKLQEKKVIEEDEKRISRIHLKKTRRKRTGVEETEKMKKKRKKKKGKEENEKKERK